MYNGFLFAKMVFSARRASMGRRYVIAKESVFADCWVTPEAYEGVFERLEEFVSPFFSHLPTRLLATTKWDAFLGFARSYTAARHKSAFFLC